MKDVILDTIESHVELVAGVRGALIEPIAAAAQAMVDCLAAGNVIYWCGNGGSAADAQHLAAELVGRFTRERRALASIALGTNTSTLTSVGNDYGFETVFSRQVEGLVRAGDVLVAISTSGTSINVVRAVEAANEKGALTIGLLGRDGGSLKGLCERSLVVPAHNTARVQEMHILIGHILCDLVEQVCAQ